MYSNLYDRSLNMAITKMLYLKFGDGNGPNLCRVKKVKNVSPPPWKIPVYATGKEERKGREGMWIGREGHW